MILFTKMNFFPLQNSHFNIIWHKICMTLYFLRWAYLMKSLWAETFILINSQLKTILFMCSDKKNEIKLRKILTLEILTVVRSSHQRYSVTKGVFRNFAKFTGKHLCQILFFNKVAGLSLVSTNAVFGRLSSK